MIPNVTVPMNFGRNLLTSPTHSNLVLKTSEGGEVRVSSVILSFNSPVIGHMTGDLHMTSVDMLDFTEEAVRVFVDAAYSGSAENVTREVFRDVNKISIVFEMTWLADKCEEYFRGVAESITVGNYTDLLFLFEEAAYVFEMVKSRQLVSVAIKKILELNWEQQFIEQYLENAHRLSNKKLDMVIELAGNKVNYIVQNLTKQLSRQVQTQGPVFNVSTRYLLDNSDLYLCRKSDKDLFDELFNMLEEVAPDRESMRWVLQLLKKSQTQEDNDSCSKVVPVAGSSVTSVTRCNDIPIFYPDFDKNLSLDELLDWLSNSDKVTNVLMAVEYLRIWELCRVFRNNTASLKSVNKSVVKNTLVNLIKTRDWLKLPHSLSNVCLGLWNGYPNLSQLCVSEGESSGYFDMQCLDKCKDSQSVLSGKEPLVFQFQHPDVPSCDKPGKCGFMLKTVPGERKIKLCTETEDYHDQPVHFHDQIRAENIHLYFVASNNYLEPFIWLHWINKEKCTNTVDKYFNEKCGRRTFGILYKI